MVRQSLATALSRYCKRPRSCRGPRAWRTRTGASGDPGDLDVFTTKRGMDHPLIKSGRCIGCAMPRANTRTDGDTADRRKRSDAGRTPRSRSCS